jgi:cytoskeletal protein CcmA (bactofilin family)
MAMFGGNKESQNLHELSSSNTHIAKGAAITGDIETYGTIRLEGKIFGNLRSKGKTSLGESSFVQGNILAQSAEIAGEVKGTVEIAEILTLKATAIVNGDIVCNKLIVEAGAVFNGKCQMGTIIKEIVIRDQSASGQGNNHLKKEASATPTHEGK